MALRGDILPIINDGIIKIKLQTIKVSIFITMIDVTSILIGTTEI